MISLNILTQNSLIHFQILILDQIIMFFLCIFQSVLEIQKSSIRPGIKCVIVDDLIATGGSLGAAVKLLRSNEAEVLGCLVVIELTSLKGREKIPDVPVHSLIKYD